MPNHRYFADVSNNNPVVNVANYANGPYTLIALKASEGLDFIDPDHAQRSREAHLEGLTVIHYHFARPDRGNSAEREAHFFVSVVKPTWRKGDYLWLDMERGVARHSESDAAWAAEFCAVVSRAFGATPIVYGNESTLNSALLHLRVKGERYAPAKYGGTPTVLAGRRVKWSEQYTDGRQGEGPHAAVGIGNCDMNYLFSRRIALVLALRKRRRRRRLHPVGVN